MARTFALAAEWPRLPLAALKLARTAAPGSLALARIEALLTLRGLGWAAARGRLIEISNRAREEGRPGAPFPARLGPPRTDPPVALAAPSPHAPEGPARDVLARIVVYTTRIGDAAPLPPRLAGVSEAIRFVCFTDAAATAQGWTRAPVDPGAEAAFHKIRPDLALADVAPGAEWSLYLDPDRVLVGNLEAFLERWLLRHDFALWRHPQAVDWRGLAELRLATGDGRPEAVLAEVDACLAAGVAKNRGAHDTGVIWRRHVDPAVRALSAAWWDHARETRGPDEMALYRLLNGAPPAVRPVVLPAALGPADGNLLTARLRRPPPPSRPRPAPASVSGRRPVTFLYHMRPSGMNVTTLLRGKMLSELVAARFADRYEVAFVRDLDAVRGQVVVADGQVLYDNDLDALKALQRRNVAVIGAWEDSRPRVEAVPFLDAHMTLSIPQTLDLSRRFPATPAFFVTHQVNPGIPDFKPPTDRLRAVYVGRLTNTRRPASLAGDVDLIQPPRGDDGWTAALARYNCHWAVRNRLPHDGHKPFLKGYVAARCGSPVIVSREDEAAAHYLGDDYPFFADGDEDAALELAWARAAGAFGGPDWRRALEVMRHVAARSTLDQVFADFEAMIEAVAG